jgi:hypothetical protein
MTNSKKIMEKILETIELMLNFQLKGLQDLFTINHIEKII